MDILSHPVPTEVSGANKLSNKSSAIFSNCFPVIPSVTLFEIKVINS